MQSPFLTQFILAMHDAHRPPPQSTSVSLPFLSPSVQPGATQLIPTQTDEAQSPAMRHPLPTSHLLVHDPPQSTSVSPPFFTPSVQLGIHRSGGAIAKSRADDVEKS